MKAWYKSKTVWVNVITLIVSLLTTFAASDLIKDYPSIVGVLASAISALNIVLRLLTNTAISGVLNALGVTNE